MPQRESRTCSCCKLWVRIPLGLDGKFICTHCRPHTGASDDSHLRRDADHAARYYSALGDARSEIEYLRDTLRRAGDKIQWLEREHDEDEVLARVKRLHFIVLTTGKCKCGRPSNCPTLSALERPR